MRIFLILLLTIGVSFANTTQNNTSGSNTSITGGYNQFITQILIKVVAQIIQQLQQLDIEYKNLHLRLLLFRVTNSGSDVCLAGAFCWYSNFWYWCF